MHSDGWTDYNGLVDLGHQKHYRVDRNENEFSNDTSKWNGKLGIAKTQLATLRGFAPQSFHLNLKETVFRFNYRNDNLYLFGLKTI